MGKKETTQPEKETFWQKIKNYSVLIGLIGGTLGILSTGLSVSSYCDTKQDRQITKQDRQITDTLQKANSIFENAGVQDTIQLRKAFNSYKKVITAKPSELTGYRNFLNLAKTRRDFLDTNCDLWIKWYLQRAQELYDNKTVQDMLNQCKE
jgi:hypothetical protein